MGNDCVRCGRKSSPGRSVDGQDPDAPVHYLLFGGLHRHLNGGTRDVVGVFKSEASARRAFLDLRQQWSNTDGWAELAVIGPAGRLARLGWFGTDERRGIAAPGLVVKAGAEGTPPRPWRRWSHRRRLAVR